MSIFDIYRNKTVFVTGHTGFKGSWLCEWLLHCGARVIGYSCDIPTRPSHFKLLGLSGKIDQDIRADIRDFKTLSRQMRQSQPDFVFHLAAQPIVRKAYTIPRETIDTNLMGTVNVLESLRLLNKKCVAIMITTDKVYENREWVHAYRESDRLGGHDPYSASKACAEIAISSYVKSFFSTTEGGRKSAPTIAVASVRAGNVIGGGDWAVDRIVPDCVRHLQRKQPIPVRNKTSTRPWQHVLEPLGGYLLLSRRIYEAHSGTGTNNNNSLRNLCTPFNFGPELSSNRTVRELVDEMLKHWPGSWEDCSKESGHHEASRLNLAIDKSFHLLEWKPLWGFEKTVEATVRWYREFAGKRRTGSKARQITLEQIVSYEKELTRKFPSLMG